MADVTIYTAVPCGYCRAAKSYFDGHDVPYTEIDLTGDMPARMDLLRRTSSRTVPQIFIGDHHVGGYTELRALAARGELSPLLQR